MRKTEIIQRRSDDDFTRVLPVDVNHMSAYSCLGMRSALHHRGFTTRSGQWLEVWWTVDQRTGHVTDFFEDTRGLNRR